MSGCHDTTNSFLNKQLIERTGNSVIYLATNIPDLNLTKLLKLVYLLDELSTKERGIPFLGLNYKVWQSGPVNRDLYIDINDGVKIFKDYFTVKQGDNSSQIISIKDFNDDEFSDCEIALLEKLVQLFKFTSGQDLVNLTHRPSTLWYRKAKENGLLEQFNEGVANSSEVGLDLEDLLAGQDEKIKIFKENTEFQKTIDALQKAK